MKLTFGINHHTGPKHRYQHRSSVGRHWGRLWMHLPRHWMTQYGEALSFSSLLKYSSALKILQIHVGSLGNTNCQLPAPRSEVCAFLRGPCPVSGLGTLLWKPPLVSYHRWASLGIQSCVVCSGGWTAVESHPVTLAFIKGPCHILVCPIIAYIFEGVSIRSFEWLGRKVLQNYHSFQAFLHLSSVKSDSLLFNWVTVVIKKRQW